MDGNRPAPAPLQFLSSWKEIANYLGKGVRTVQRYEYDFGLPVRRPAKRARGSVIATRIEIDAWVKATPLRELYLLPRNKPASDVTVIQSLNANAGKMFKLCEEMIALRSELQIMRYQLRESVSTLRKELAKQGHAPGPTKEQTTVWHAPLAKSASTRVQ